MGSADTAIVKILMKYEGQAANDRRWAMGSGWLVSPDTFITAGHCVYDWSGDGRGFGRVKLMKVYIGYHGRESTEETPKTPDGIPQVQARLATDIITTQEWLNNPKNRHRDVAFVKVDNPFEGNLQCFTFNSTPKYDAESLGVVGYPGDKTLGTDAQEEQGAEMYGMFATVQYDLNSSDNPWHLLEYQISTFAGRSGSPVIRQGADTATVSMGTHVYGSPRFNSASPINKPYGVDYQTFIDTLHKPHPGIAPFSGSPAKPDRANGNGTESKFDTVVDVPPDTDGPKDFWDVLKGIGRAVATVGQVALPLATPLLGPLPVDFGSNPDPKPKISVSDEDLVPAGAVERAVLAEAALQTIMRTEHGPTSQKLLAKMKEHYDSSAPSINNLRKKVARVPSTKTMPAADHPEASMPGPESDLIAALAHTQAKVYEGSESFFDTMGDLFNKGLRIGKPLLLQGAQLGLQRLDTYLASKADKTESIMTSLEDADVQAARLLAKRAVMAECALQAVLRVPTAELKAAQIPSDPVNSIAPEGFLDGLLGAAQSIGSAIMGAAPVVLNSALPILINSIAQDGVWVRGTKLT
ncbi:hypothetical protein GQ53DRAFT_851495 [Thozetella sp. PMI_491]|nr:hypothetical protein GQ53DRAFT_851495 [Thozetella sp. PMI_491]